jgi:hypothetical protein
MTEPSEDQLGALWRDQQEENSIMTAKAIRALARNHNDTVRDRQLLGYGIIAVEAVVFGWYALKAPNAIVRAGELLILMGLTWMVWRIWLRRPGRLPDVDASARTLVAFQRTELVRRTSSYTWMLVSAGPVVAGLMVMLAGLRTAHPAASDARLVTIFVLLGIWFVAGWFMQRRQSQRIRQQIEDLDAISEN